MTCFRSAFVLTAALLAAVPAAAQAPPPGFTSLFNGKDLTGWRGRQPNYNPAEEAKLSPEARAEKQAQWNAERDAHWRVGRGTAPGRTSAGSQGP